MHARNHKNSWFVGDGGSQMCNKVLIRNLNNNNNNNNCLQQ